MTDAETDRALAYWANQRAIQAGRLRAARLLSAPHANLRALQARWAPLKRQPGSADYETARAPMVGAEDFLSQVILAGPPGLPGATGPQGIQGPAGTSGGSVTWHQDVAAATWIIPNPLGYNPAVTVIDSNGADVLGDVAYPDAQTVTITFAVPLAGTAYLS